MSHIINQNEKQFFMYCNERSSIIRTELEKDKNQNAFFCQRGEVLLNYPFQRKVKLFRISLTEKNFLHLQGIFLYTKNGEEESSINKDYTVSFSSVYDDEKCNNFTLNKNVTPYIFHTKNEECPWVIIEFFTTIEFSSIKIINRMGKSNIKSRSRGLLIEVSLDGELWETIFDHGKTCDKFVNELSNTGKEISSLGFDSSDAKLIDKILAECITYQYTQIHRLFHSIASEFVARNLKAYVSSEFLAQSKLEYTFAYGIKRTFRFWSEAEKRVALEEAMKVIILLRQLTDNVFFAFGSVLGFVREPGSFVPHDYDLDLMLVLPNSLFSTFENASRHVVPFLEKNGFVTLTKGTINGAIHISWTGAFLKRLDVFIALEDSQGRVSAYPVHRGKYLQSHYLYNPIDINILGIECPIPKNPFQYLEATYGKDWRIPIDQNFHSKKPKIFE